VEYETDALIAEDYTSTFTVEQLFKDLALDPMEVGRVRAER
jgi:hypothetical protein